MKWTNQSPSNPSVAYGLVAIAAFLVSMNVGAQVLAMAPGERIPYVDSGVTRQDMTWSGSVTTQGDVLMNAPTARSTFNVNGAGIKVGIISDSFNALGGMNAGVLSNNLPGIGNTNGFTTPVNIVKDDAGTDEGRAMAEIVHDIAPGAQILFHSAFNNTNTSPGQTIGTAINALVAAGANIIVDDVAWLTMPAYQDGYSAQAAHAAFLAGVPYFSSAGNNGNNAYEGVFNSLGGFHNFDANNNDAVADKTILRIGTLPNNGIVRAVLWWDDPYPTVGGGSPTADIDFSLVDLTTNTTVSSSVANQLGGADAYEFVGVQNTSGATHQYGLKVNRFAGDANKKLKIQVFGSTISDDDDTNSPTIFGHNSADGAVAVAAASVFNINSPESFTSLGPTTLLRDSSGNSLANPLVRNTALITGPDGGNNSFFGSDSGSDADSFPNFFGTSAAAPHVAAVAALLMERAADLGISLTPTQLYGILFNSTVDLNTPGYDFLTGYGRLDAFSALSHLVPEPGTISLVTLALFACVVHRPRREH
jgi:subtilase family protein